MGKTPDPEYDLSKVIESLSSHKSSKLTPAAVKAKSDYVQLKDDESERIKFPKLKKLRIIDEFNDHVRLLRTIFEDSHFDEIVFHLANPSRLFIIQLIIGILRGIGFAIGVLVIVFLLLYLVMSNLSSASLALVMNKILHLVSLK